MSRACSICRHPRVSEIDAALSEGTAYRRVAKQFEASAPSVYRHAREHLPIGSASGAVAPESEASDVTAEAGVIATPHSDGARAPVGKRSVDLLDYMLRVQERTFSILESARAAGRHETGLKAIRESRENLALISKLQGQPGTDMLDLMKLSAEDLAVLIRASLGELSARDRKELLLESPPGLAELVASSL